MLEDTRKRGATIFVYLVFGTLIAIFAVSFGPASVTGGRGGCSAGSEQTRVTIDGRDYGRNSWVWLYNNTRGENEQQRVTGALDRLILRELLALEAERRGLEIPEEVVDDNLKLGRIYIGGQLAEDKAFHDQDGFFDYRLLERFVQMYDLSIGGFRAEQRRELLAATMIDILASGAHASRDEAMTSWLQDELKVTVDAVRFRVSDYRDKMIVTDADVEQYLAAHDAEVLAEYNKVKGTEYENSPPRLRVRRIFVAKERKEEAKPPEEAGAGAGTAAEEARPALDPAERKLQLAREEIVAGKKTFAEVAAALESDEAIRAKSGDVGWVLRDAPNLDPELVDPLKDLKPGGEPSPVLKTDKGFWLFAVEGERAGKIEYGDVKKEIAARLAVDVWAKDLARREALAALEQAKKSGKPLAELFEAPEEPEDAEKQGALPVVWTEDVPAEWGQDTAGEPAGGGAEPPAPAPGPDALMTPPAGPLPELAKMDPPAVEHLTGLARAGERVGALGHSAELVEALFEQLEDGALADRIYEVKQSYGDVEGYVVAQLIERTDPDLNEFDEDADARIKALEALRAGEIVKDWLVSRCEQVVGGVRINPGILSRDEEGNTLQYGGVCDRFKGL